jgi:hypothetical protein
MNPDAATLGNWLTLLQIVAILGGGMFFLYRMEGKIQLVTSTQDSFIHRLEKVDEKLEQLTSVIIQLAKQEQRMDAADARVQELSTRIDGMTHIYELGFEGKRVIRRRKK